MEAGRTSNVSQAIASCLTYALRCAVGAAGARLHSASGRGKDAQPPRLTRLGRAAHAKACG
jgi:hypothetical protein